MSLSQLFDELFDPRDPWIQQCIRHTNNTLSNCRRQLVQNPQVDLYPVEGGMELKVDLPGTEKGNVKVTVEGNMLILTGERKNTVERDEGQCHYAERRFGQFTRRLRLPYHADPKTVSAKFENGVLTVMIPQPTNTMAGEITII